MQTAHVLFASTLGVPSTPPRLLWVRWGCRVRHPNAGVGTKPNTVHAAVEQQALPDLSAGELMEAEPTA